MSEDKSQKFFERFKAVYADLVAEKAGWEREYEKGYSLYDQSYSAAEIAAFTDYKTYLRQILRDRAEGDAGMAILRLNSLRLAFRQAAAKLGYEAKEVPYEYIDNFRSRIYRLEGYADSIGKLVKRL